MKDTVYTKESVRSLKINGLGSGVEKQYCCNSLLIFDQILDLPQIVTVE